MKWVTTVAKPLILFGFILLIWQLIVVAGVVPSFTLAAPSSILAYIPRHVHQLATNAGATLVTMGLGYLCALAIGIGFGILITQFKLLEEALLPLLIITQVIPSVAIAPVLVLLLGFGSLPKVATATVISFFPILINTISGLRSVDDEMQQLSRVLRASRIQYLWRFGLPTALPQIFAGARIGITLSLIGAVVGEFVTPDKGLGYLVLQGTNNLDPNQTFAALTVLSVIGIGAFMLIRAFERVGIPWAHHTAT